MRIARLDLLRYGKFTDRSIPLPKTQRDFHLVVGPNEAGKSTVRSAILDLLFGIETRSRYNFLHAHGDMRLGALLEQGLDALDCVRLKARTKTLQTPTGTTLADNALAPFLGALDRGFFDQMFGLDHARLVKGGQEILKASNDVGQILFQSAAGIGRFGEVRDALEAEANALWAKRRSGEREYYIAADELERAEVALKQATIRTKDWLGARDLVARLEDEGDRARDRYLTLEQRRLRLERIRRVAPLLATLHDREQALGALGAVIPLPAQAGQQLTRAELDMAKAGQAHQVFEEQVQGLATASGEIHPDPALLARQADIQALSEQRQRLRNHPSDILKRQEEVLAHGKAMAGLAHELGWAEQDEATLEGRLPSQLDRSGMKASIRRHDVLAQALAAGQESQSGKQAEIRALDAAVEALPKAAASPTLKAALAAAQALGDVAAQERRLVAQVTRAERELAAVTLELGPWCPALDGLRGLQLPTQDELSSLQQRQAQIETSASALAQQIADQQARLGDLDLEIAQYQAAHHPVSLADLAQGRAQRDGLWQRIKTGDLAPDAAAPDYEARVAAADALSDRRHDKAQEAATLQSRLAQRGHLALQLAGVESRAQANAEAQATFAQAWQARVAALGLAGMALTQVSAWRAVRERCLRAADDLAEAQARLEELRCAAAQAHSGLVAALERTPAPDPEQAEPLSALVLRAGEAVDAASRAQTERATLAAQRATAQIALGESERKLSQVQAGLTAWQGEWDRRLTAFGLPAGTDTGSAEVALTLFDRMDDHLRQMRELRTARIDAMQRDLDDFAARAGELARALAPALCERPADETARILAQHLADAWESDKERRRLRQELDRAHERSAKEQARIQEAQAALSTLLHVAGVVDNDALREAIARSDRVRALDTDIRGALQALQEVADGLPRDDLEAERAAVDLASVPAELAAVKEQVDEVLEQQRRNAAERSSAQAALACIAGQDAAARAEAQRQEALARMANAAERYLKVAVAARLLRWAIERYRETKQGPMLSRAGDIFASLTLGSFVRLVVDYEKEPLALYGQRDSGERVAIEALSDGTRDQLYLALRLAALELHLEQAPAMPFIADDLAINYDDARAKAALEALVHLSERTQVVFLSHHDHLVPVAEAVFGPDLNLVRLG